MNRRVVRMIVALVGVAGLGVLGGCQAPTTVTPPPGAANTPPESGPRTMEPQGDPMANPVPVEITTASGRILLHIYPNAVPSHAENFIKLVNEGYYDGLTWHRVVAGFVIQTGDPSGTGSGGVEVQVWTVTVTVDQPGAAKARLETDVLPVIERAARSVNGVDTVTVSADEGRGRVRIEFAVGADPEAAEPQLREVLAGLRRELPRGAKDPVIGKFVSASKPLRLPRDRSPLRHDKTGVLAMAQSQLGVSGSQFYITMGPTPHLDRDFIVFGQVVEGQEVVDRVRQGETIEAMRVLATADGDEAEAGEDDGGADG